jgi:predicted glutamine amidotransferase
MCIAILNQNSNPVSKTYFENSLSNNSDGFGMAWIENGKIKLFKSLSTDSKALYKKYLKRFENTESPILLHFRISTSGKIDLSNTHPFHVSENLVFMHNGIISGLGNALENDTRHFNRVYLKHISENDLLSNNAIQSLISDRIGYSKLVFLNNQGQFSIINEKLGIWESDGNWYSNNSYSYGAYSYGDYWESWKAPKSSKGCKVPKAENESEVYSICSGCDGYGLTSFNNSFQAYLCKECKDWIENEL